MAEILKEISLEGNRPIDFVMFGCPHFTLEEVKHIAEKIKGKKLEKWEQEFYRNNKRQCDLKRKHTKEEQAEIDYWNRLLG